MELDLWQPLAGLGLFLYAMRVIEDALQTVSGPSFRRFLRRNTNNPLQGVLSGAVATAVLQSSSLVGLLMLALVGAGVIEMRNALSVIFGANLGTTATGWIVATIGFKLDLAALSLPMIGIGGLVTVADARRQAGRIVLGIGLLLLGLDLMKNGLGGLAAAFDVDQLGGYSALQYLLFGVVFSALVQSSSARRLRWPSSELPILPCA